MPDMDANLADRLLAEDVVVTPPAGTGGGGLSTVATDSTITGDGSTGDPLSVAEPYTAQERIKLGGIEAGATADLSGPQIVSSIDSELGSDTWQGGGGGGTGTADGVVESGRFNPFGSEIVLERSVGDDVSIDVTGLQSDWNAPFGITSIANKPNVPTRITDLSDTPAVLGSAGQVPVVNTDGDALVFEDQPQGSAITFLGRQEVRPARTGTWTNTGITLDNSDWFLINFGEGLSGAGVTTGEYLQVNGNELRGLPNAVAGNASFETGLLELTIGLADVNIGRDSANQLLIAVQLTSDFFNPLTVYGLTLTVSAGSGSGLASVESDTTLTGVGSVTDPLRVTTPLTTQEKNQLVLIGDGQSDWEEFNGASPRFIRNKPGLTQTAQLIPPGGNTDYLLVKRSDSDFDTEWVASTTGETGRVSVLTETGSANVDITASRSFVGTGITIPTTEFMLVSFGTDIIDLLVEGSLQPNPIRGEYHTIRTSDLLAVASAQAGEQIATFLSSRITNSILITENVDTQYAIGRSNVNEILLGVTVGDSADDARPFTVLAWDINAGGGQGATEFTGLTDTPNNLGAAGQIVVVNQQGDQLVFVDPSTGTGLITVATNTTITGDGTASSPLAVAEAYTDAERQKLSGIASGAQVNVGVEYTQAEKDKLTDIETAATADQTGEELVNSIDTQLGSATWQSGGTPEDGRLVPSGGTEDQILTKASDTTGDTEWATLNAIEAVVSDDTLEGSGLISSRLRVATPFTSAEKSKLTGIEESAKDDQTGLEVVGLLQGLTGTARLDYSAIEGGPPAGAQANVGVEYTQAEKTKLGTVEDSATADQTDTEIVAAVDAEVGNTAWKTGQANVGQEFTQTEKNKLRDIQNRATADQNAGEIRDLLQSLSGTARLGYAFVAGGPPVGAEANPPAGELVPSGGTTGQILGKVSGADGDTDWQDAPTGGGGGGASAYTDLTDTPVGYGTAGQVPAMNSTADALIWADQTGGGAGTEGPPGPRGAVGPAGPAGASASDTRVEIHRGTLTTEEGRAGGRWQGIVEPAVCPESGILRFHFIGGSLNTLSSEISAAEIRELDPIALGASTASTPSNSKSIRASANVRSNATRMIAIARTAENHLLFLQWQGNEFRNITAIVYQHGAPQPEVAGENYDVISEEQTARQTRVDVPAVIRRVFNIGFPNVTSPAGNTLLVNLSVGTRSNTIQGQEIEIWVNGAALPDVSVPEGGSAVDFELDDTHKVGNVWSIEARTTTSTGGQLEQVAWTYSVVRYKNDFETFMDFTPGDVALRAEIPWSRAFNRPVVISDYSEFTVEIRDRSSSGISSEKHRLNPDEIHSFLDTEAAALATKTAHVFSAVFSVDGTASLVEAYDRSKSRPGLANPRLSFTFANPTEAGADLMTSIRGVDGTNGIHQAIAEGDISVRIRGRRKGTS